jgi:murein DD-endopeptidase MepM/ murein hydrolase activator NlpD
MTATVASLALLLSVLAVPAPGPAPGLPPHGWQQVATQGVWPLQPTPAVVAGFAPPPSPYVAGHRGVDLAGRAGQPVRAAVGGRVTFAGSLAGRGVVVVAHGRTRTTYEPVRASVVVGETVAAGDRLGSLEATGGHCLPAICLHWGLLEDDTYLDPLTLVGAGPVRLLPLEGPDAVGQARGWAWR